ncbi:MAG: hypothetical protein JWO13_1849 [Acidobacteriales bacterium]|nr:hypothetical protein [Terriglobales bacterium]
MRKALQVVIFLLLSLAALGAIAFTRFESNLQARRQNALVLARNCQSGHLSYQEFHKKVGFPFTASADRISKISSGYRQLHLQQTTVEVLTLLGEPDHAQAGGSKKGDAFLFCRWMYELKTPEDLVNYKNNSWVELFFDANGRLKDKDAVNVSGIPNRPMPGDPIKSEKPRARIAAR